MPEITLHTPLTDVVATDEMLLPVLENFDIRLGIGDKSIECICRENGLQPLLLLCVINTITDSHYVPSETLQTFSILRLIDYLNKENEHFEKELNEIATLAQLFAQHTKNGCSSTFEELLLHFKQDFLSFLSKKTENIFSPVTHLYEAYYSPFSKNKEKEPIVFLEIDAEGIHQKLSGTKMFLTREMQGDYDTDKLNMLFFRLSNFEKRLQNQFQIEMRLLKTLVRKMEESILKKHKKRSPSPGYSSHISISSAQNGVLSAREIEVLRLLSQGYINKEVANRLQISLHTVISHRKHIMEKLSIKTISGLTAYAMKNRII